MCQRPALHAKTSQNPSSLEAKFSHSAHANKVKGTIFSLGVIHTYYMNVRILKKAKK